MTSAKIIQFLVRVTLRSCLILGVVNVQQKNMVTMFTLELFEIVVVKIVIYSPKIRPLSLLILCNIFYYHEYKKSKNSFMD